MQKVSYMGNDETTEFYFSFPYFETSNVVVSKNGTPATGCNIIGNSGGLDADYPFIGGKVVFDIAPTSLDSITIARQLPLTRIADYQPLTQITPTTLNQDLNYLMEVIKDRKGELTDLITKYSEIADKESTEIILARITAIHEEITDIDAKIQALGDISTLRTDITTNTNNIATNTGNITTLDTRTTGMIDYVVASQAPTAENNYTWYRKYKSGWVEQGGMQTGSQEATMGYDADLGTITLPVPMNSSDYYANGVNVNFFLLAKVTKTTTTLKLQFVPYETTRVLTKVYWCVCGKAA
ncbi:MAG: hypothetical protein MJ164_03210 [Alphaproteobacteria bacterium]|nr:hypothetical protein [Alphaproteobacteria bacterium]